MNIKIVETPKGVLGEEMLKAWVGLILPLATEKEIQEFGITRKLEQSNAYCVSFEPAMKALEGAGKNEVADIYRKYFNHPSMLGGKYFTFQRSYCEVISA